MLSLTRIFLHNWHRFGHCVIDVKDSLYLAGHNGSGKSSLLDAIQLVLVANLKRIRFNSSAQDASDRDVDTYVRGKLGEDRWLRPGRTVAYVALEFTNTPEQTPSSGIEVITLGVCIEAEPGRSVERTYFILGEALNPDVLMPQGKPLTRQQLRKAFRERPGARTYDHIEEYQTDMLDRLGGLSERFLDLFLRALYFRPISNIDDFVEQWLLEEKELSLDTLRSVRERLSDLRSEAGRTSQRVQRLDVIVAQQQEVKRLAQLRDQYQLLGTLLRAEAAQRAVAQVDQVIATHERDLRATQETLDQTETALKEAEQSLEDTRRRLGESGVARRRDELAHKVEQALRDAESISRRWRSLRTDLQSEAEQLRPLISTTTQLTSDEAQALSALLTEVGTLGPNAMECSGLRASVEAAAQHLGSAHGRTIETRALLASQADELRRRVDQLQGEIDALHKQGTIRYRPEVERLRDRLQAILGERPKPLCELLEVTDPRWQDAVEAMLGARRFNLVVAPQHFARAARELDRARAEERLYDVGLIDLERVQRESRPRRADSLARFVTAQLPAVAGYVSTVMGDIVTCDTVDELRRYRRAVTPEVVVYAEFTTRSTRPERYRPHFIGARARQSQIDERKREMAEVKQQLDALNRQIQELQALVGFMNHSGTLLRLAERLNSDLDDRALRAQVESAQAELQTLDLSSLSDLEQRARELKAEVDHMRAEQRKLDQQHGTLQAQLDDLQRQRQDRMRTATERAQEATMSRQQFAPFVAVVDTAEAMLAERIERADLGDEAGKADSSARRFETQRTNEVQRLAELCAQYNTAEQFAARAGDPDELRYAQERERLATTDLPTYESNIEQAEREAEDELREHVLHTLREQIGLARRKLDLINDALSQLPPFGNERYRFICTRADDAQEFYDLIMADSQLLGSGSLFESRFYAEHKAAFDRFYDTLTRRPQSRAEEEEQERLTDYRHYLSYDIEVTNSVSGQKSRLSRIMNQTSGGETQTPFYLTIAASFVQLYRIQERNRRPTIRLVAFDEAFSKMDQQRIGATLDLFQRFNLQVVTATPLERCEYLAPKMCTSLVLSAVKDTVHIEPYHNYTARLSALEGPQEQPAMSKKNSVPKPT